MGSASSIIKVAIQSSSSSLTGKILSRITSKNLIPSTSSGNCCAPTVTEESSPLRNCNASPLEMKLLYIRDLVTNETKDSASFQKVVDEHGDKDFLEKFQILDLIERKIFCRMLMVEHVAGEYHQLDEIVPLQDILSLDNASSAPIHMVCEKLRKFVCNYQTSYERWLEILSSLQDELLAQLIGDYDEYMGIKDSQSPKVLLHIEERLTTTFHKLNNSNQSTSISGCITRVASFAPIADDD